MRNGVLFLWLVVSTFSRKAIVDGLNDYNNVAGRAKSHTDTATVKYIGSFDTFNSCKEAVLAYKLQCFSFTYHTPEYGGVFARQCFGVVTKYYDWFPSYEQHIQSGRIWYGCSHDSDCSLNGECRSGSCHCSSGWTGRACTALDILPTPRDSGYKVTNNRRNISSWGGPVLRGEDGIYNMWVSEMENHCGIIAWGENSHIIHATSTTPVGPYKPQKEVFPIFSHEPDVKRAPNGKYVMFLTQRVPNTGRPICHCIDGRTGRDCHDYATPDMSPTVMSQSASANGPWSDPVVVMENTKSDTNLSPLITSNGSLVGLWRTFEVPHTSEGYSRIHLMEATDWTDPSSYKYSIIDRDILQMGGPQEDPYLYMDQKNRLHALFHNMHGFNWDGCFPCGGHAYSQDGGQTWIYTGGDAYPDNIVYTDNTTYRFARRERPHLLFDNQRRPVLLTNGVTVQGSDYSFTSAVPIRVAG